MDINQFFNDYWHILAIVALWSIFWKAVALWRSARKNHKAWFVAIFLINSASLLELFYLFVFSRGENVKAEERKSSKGGSASG